MLNRMKTKLKLLKISGLTPRVQSGKTTISKKHDYDLDFRGDKQENHPSTRQIYLGSNRQSSEFRYRDSQEMYQMQPRKIRFKSFMYLCFYLFWYLGAAIFIMKRVGGDDIQDLEKEAYERLRTIEKSKNV